MVKIGSLNGCVLLGVISVMIYHSVNAFVRNIGVPSSKHSGYFLSLGGSSKPLLAQSCTR